MKKLLAIVVLFSAAFSVEAQYDKKAKELLDNMSAKYQKVNSFRASFTYSMESPVNDVSDSFTGEIMVKGDGSFFWIGYRLLTGNADPGG